MGTSTDEENVVDIENMTWEQLAAVISHMTPEQQQQPVLVWDANNDVVDIINTVGIAGEEEEDEIAPSDDFISDNQPYLMYSL